MSFQNTSSVDVVFGGLGQSITLMVVNKTDNTILGSDFKMFFSNGGEVDGVINIPPHTTTPMQEWNSVGGSPLLSWFITYQGAVIASNPNNTNITTVTYTIINIPLPPNVVFTTGGVNALVMEANVFFSTGPNAAAAKAAANAAALKQLNLFGTRYLELGVLVCS
jgi:hypothetical protein